MATWGKITPSEFVDGEFYSKLQELHRAVNKLPGAKPHNNFAALLTLGKEEQMKEAKLALVKTEGSEVMKDRDVQQPMEYDLGRDVMGGNASGAMIHGYSSPSEYTPEIDPHFSLAAGSQMLLDIFLWFMDKPAEPIYIFGPTGAGKTSTMKQIAAKLNYPVFETTGHSRLEFPELVGHWKVNSNGGMTYEYGPLAMAMKLGGIFLINEMDLLDPSTSAGLNTILDGAPLMISENDSELIIPQPGFRFVATANTRGAEDDTGHYHGTLRQNLALMDRFLFVKAEYADEASELAILDSYYPDTEIPKTIKVRMIKMATDARGAFLAGNLQVVLTTRGLIRWCNILRKCRKFGIKDDNSPVSYAFQRALNFRANEANAEYLNEMLQRHFDGLDEE